MKTLTLVLVLGALTASFASAQSLAELARKERARRQRLEESEAKKGKSYDEHNLNRVRQGWSAEREGSDEGEARPRGSKTIEHRDEAETKPRASLVPRSLLEKSRTRGDEVTRAPRMS
jgi:type IV secretory pathway VirB9-like protein